MLEWGPHPGLLMPPTHDQGATGKPIPVPAQPPFAHANQKGGRFRCRLPSDMRVGHCTAVGTTSGLCTQEGGPSPVAWRLPHRFQDPVPPPLVTGGGGHRGGGASQSPRRVPRRCWDHVWPSCEGARLVTWGPHCHLWIPHSHLSCVAFLCKRRRGSCSRDPLPCVGAYGGGGGHSMEEGHTLKGARAVPPSVWIPARHVNG